jgi:outer membrane protein assembly factor BamB
MKKRSYGIASVLVATGAAGAAAAGALYYAFPNRVSMFGGLTRKIGGNFFALDAANGQKLWGQDLGGAIGGGVITYTADGAQRVAVAAGFTHLFWATKIVTAKVVVLGLDNASTNQ